MNNIHVHNFNEYFCKHDVRKKKEIWHSTFCRGQNANDKKMAEISAFEALVTSRFSNTNPLIPGLKPIRAVSNVTKQDTPCESQ
jgi:hypothetical protein